MSTFTVEKIERITGKLKLFLLYINGKCEFKEFIEGLERAGNYESELRSIQTTMQLISECKSVPEEKHKDITPRNDPHKEYEIRTKNIRVYAFQDKKTGRIFVCGGKAGSSDKRKSLAQLRSIKKRYFQNQKKT